MNDQGLNPSSQAGGLIAGGAYAPQVDDEINIRELFDIVWSGRWVVLSIALVIFALSMAYAFTATPIFEARGLVQVEQEKSGLGSQINELSSLIGSAPAEAPAEIAILKSGMVLGAVVESLKLDIRVEPNYFPLIGEAVARRQVDLAGPAAAPLKLNSYAWGGERIRITALEMPESWKNQPFVLTAKGEAFEIHDPMGQLLLKGKVGERVSVNTPKGSFSIFVQELAARPGTEFGFKRLALQTILQEVSSQVTVAEQPRDSGVIIVQAQAESPAFAARLVNEIEDAYLKQNVERRSAQAQQSLEFLKEQLPELRGKVDKAQAELNAYQLRKGTVDVQQETELVLKQVVELETNRQRAIQERNAALQRFTGQHPVVVTLSEQIGGIEREQGKLKRQVEDLPETQQEILSLMRELEVSTQLYTALLNSAQELQVTKAGTVGNVRIIDRSLPPLLPIKPKKKIVLGLGLLLGVFAGVSAVFAIRALIKGVDRPEEVERVIGLPTYASIPYSQVQKSFVSKLKNTKGTDSLLLASVDANDVAIEALRSLRTSLHFAMMEAPNNIVMLTGPVAALGKSFVSINLGAVLAMSGKRVVVIDADMRRGRLHRYVGAERKPGISDYIAGTPESATILRKTPVEGLHFIANGTRPPNPSEILLSERFAELLKVLSTQYDYVLIDTPPVLPVTDAAIIGRLAGTTLIVLKAAEHPMRAIEETVKRLRQAGVAVRGMIFNQVGARVGSYGYGSYGQAYGYSSYGYSSARGKKK